VIAPLQNGLEDFMSGAETTKRREGELTGPRQAKCIVTITRRGSVETLAINDVEPRGIADGNYTLTVKGEPVTRWKRDHDGWERLG
jgi:ABC-type Fe3+-citrate transport system substrate-binding protein